MSISFRCRPVWTACVLALASAFAAHAGEAGERGPVRKAASAPGFESEARVIVKFKEDPARTRAQAAASTGLLEQRAQVLSARLGLALTDGRTIGRRSQVLKARGIGSQALADRLAAQSDVEYAVVDGRMRALEAPNDTLYADNQTTTTPRVGQWYLRPPTSASIVDATSVVSSINAQSAWDITRGSSSVAVAMLDTGVRPDHPDLIGKLLPGYDFINDARTANDGDARDADPSDPGDFVTSADVGVVPGCVAADVGGSSWHGTQTAGLVGAATNNGTGMAGAGRDVMLLPLRVLGRCGGYDSDIQAAMLWAAGISSTPTVNPNPVRVVNLSLGSTISCSLAYKDVIGQLNAAGVVVVASAGNEGLAVGSPASCPGVIAVAGVRHSGTKVGYSDLGPEITVAAPAGNCVNLSGTCLFPLLTTSNKGTTTPVAGLAGATYTSGGADVSLGTSFAAPLVAGSVGLMLSAHPALKPSQVMRALKATARTFPSTGAGAGVQACAAPSSTAQESECYCTTSTCGAGLLDARNAVAAEPMVAAGIRATSINIVVGVAATLDGAVNSAPSGTATLTGYFWSVISGPALIDSATNGSAVTLTANGVGTVVVGLTVTDSTGQQDSTSIALDATAASLAPPAASSGGGGGGAMELGWLLGWLASVAGIWRVTPRRLAR